MNSQDLLALRKIAAGDKCRAARNILKANLIMTDALQHVIVEVGRIHDQVAEVARSGEPWGPGNRQRVEGLAIIGNAGTGKTLAAETAIALLSPVKVGEDKTLEPKVISVTTPFTGTAGALAKDIIVGAGLPITREPKDKDAPGKVLANVARYQPTMVFIDEASRCASPAIHARPAIRKESGLMWTMAIALLDATSWPAPVMLTGLPCLLDSLYLPETDERMKRARVEASRRFRKIRIPDATIDADGPVIENIVGQYCLRLGIGSTLSASDEIGSRLIHASNYAFGTALVIAQWAVALAATRDGAKGKLKRDDFAAIHHFMGGGAMDANVFAVSDWSRINPDVLMPRSFDEARFKETNDA